LTAHEVLLNGREEVAAGTMAFRLSRPPGFGFKPGQSVTVSLIDRQPRQTARSASSRW
jgi:ferredoxin-NADP reductase